ncbi:hypothetical protein D3C73_1521100 [compost metagenome]
MQALPGQFTAFSRQLVGFGRGMRSADYVLSHLLIGCRHLRDSGGRLIRFTALAIQRLGLGP